MTDLAKLVVKLEAQTAEYDKKLDQATRTLANWKKKQESLARSVGTAVGTAVASAAGSFAYMAKQAVDSADRLSKLSQSTGISIEALSKLEYAADLSGTSVEELSGSLARLAKSAVEAQTKGSNASDALAAIGVSATNADGSIKATEALLLDIADGFSQYQDGAAKAAVAQALFGRSGADLIPLLNQGRSGIAAMGAEAEALGVVWTGTTGKAAENFNDNLTRLNKALVGMVQTTVNKALPMLDALTTKLIESAKSGGFLNGMLQAAELAFKIFVSAAAVAIGAIRQLGELTAGLGFALVELAKGKFARAGEELEIAFERAKAAGTDAIDTISAVWDEQPKAIVESAKKADDALKKTLIFGGEGSDKPTAIEKAGDKLKAMTIDLQAQIATYNQGESAVIGYRLAHGDLAAAVKEAGAAGAEYSRQIVTLTDQLDAMKATTEAAEKEQEQFNAMMEEGKRVTESVRTPLETYGATVEQLNDMLEKGAINHDTYSRAVVKAQNDMQAATEKMSEFMDQARRNSVDIIADAIESGFQGGLKNIGDEFERMLKRLTAQAIAAKIGESIFGVPSSGSAPGTPGIIDMFASFFGGGRAMGGPVSAGGMYRVGESGPEYFVPRVSGSIVPARNAGGVSVVNNFSIAAPRGEVSRATQQQVAAAVARGIASADRRNN